MKIELKVLFIDGKTSDTDAMFADFVAFERQWQRSVVKFEDELRLTDLAWLAWKSESRMRRTQLPFETWIETVESVEVRTSSDGSGDTPNLIAQDQPTG